MQEECWSSAVTIETERGAGGALSSGMGTKFSYAGLSFDKVQVEADGGRVSGDLP
jgi:hypothetical protein